MFNFDKQLLKERLLCVKENGFSAVKIEINPNFGAFDLLLPTFRVKDGKY